LTILYGTETGNSLEVAKTVVQAAIRRGLEPELCDLSDYEAEQLGPGQDVLIVVSTSGEGDPPQSVEPFFKAVEGEGAGDLAGLRYSVLALGDSAYDYFCEAGKRLDRRLEELGASRLTPRVDCDIDYEEPAEAWANDVLDLLAEGVETPAEPPAVDIAADAAQPGYDKRHPLPATIVRNMILVGPGSSKATRHVELSFGGSGLTYQPGDALGLHAANDPAVVAALLHALALAPDEPVTLDGRALALGEALEQHLEITTATPRFLNWWAEVSEAAPLHDLQSDERLRERAAFLHAHHIIDIIRRFPAGTVGAADLAGAMRPLQPRLYSIASSLTVTPDAVHLTVAPVDYLLHDEQRRGVATGQLAHRCPEGTSMQVYVHDNPHFRLPDDDRGMIMIGAGTGVAPYRGFLQERQARGATGKAMLFFGERNRATDFLYRADWEAFQRANVLTEVEVAFSRDGQEKAYVQHRLEARARDVFAWLEEGAHLYVCGDAANMAPDVHEALIRIVAKEQGQGREPAEAYVASLQSQHRYHRDIY
jgi:sulfite reductase (NADPH) flavoprotein alpha-component